MKQFISSLIVVSLASTAWAQEVQPIPPGDDTIVAIQAGQSAPFSGQLFDPQTALRWANWLRQYQMLLVIDRTYNQKMCQASTDFLSRSLELERGRYKTVTEDYQKREAELRELNIRLRSEIDNPPWYRTVWFGTTLGVAFTGLAIGAGIYVSR